MNAEIKTRIEMINKGEVPEGYKETKVGIIPEDWEVKRFGEEFKVNQGLQIPIKERYKKKVQGSYIYITNDYINNLNNNYEVEYIKDPSNSVICNSQDILMTRTGNTGIVVSGIEGVFHNNFFKVKYDEKKHCYKFLVYLLKSSYIQHNISRLAGTSTIPDLTHSDFYSLESLFPSLPEQQKIAQILSTWDEAIKLKEKLIEEKKEQKKGLMQKLLTGEIRLPGFDGEWEEVRLGDIGEVVTGTTPSTKMKEYYESGIYPWITPTDITENKYISESERYLTDKGLKVGRFLPAGSLLVTCIASIGKNAILTTNGSCNQQINAILPSENYSNEFLYYLISYQVDYIKSYAGTSATQIINKSTFESLKFLIPPLQEQKAIAQILTTADKEINLLTQELEQLKLQKKGLMQLLLTGIVRVKP